MGMVLLLTTIRLRSDGRVLAQAVRGGLDLAHVGLALDARRRADADEGELGLAQALVVVEREAQASGLEVLDDDFFQPRLVNRQLAAPEPLHFARVDVDADDLVAELSETGGGYQPNVIGSDDCDVGHCAASLTRWSSRTPGWGPVEARLRWPRGTLRPARALLHARDAFLELVHRQRVREANEAWRAERFARDRTTSASSSRYVAQLGARSGPRDLWAQAAARTGRARRGTRRTRPPARDRPGRRSARQARDDGVASLAEGADHLVDGALDLGIVLAGRRPRRAG